MKFRITLDIKTEKFLEEIFDEVRMKDFDLSKNEIINATVEEISSGYVV